MFGASDDPLNDVVIRLGERAITAADLLVFVVDGREGLVSGDERIAEELRKTNRPVLVAINKTDDKRAQASSMEFFQLGFDPVVEISAEHGHGVAELLDEIVERLEVRGSRLGTGELPPTSSSTPPDETGVAIVGRPTVGKSSLVNR